MEVSATECDADSAIATVLHDADFGDEDESVEALPLKSCTSIVAIALSRSKPRPRSHAYRKEGTRIRPERPQDTLGRHFLNLAAQFACHCMPGHKNTISSTSIWIEVGIDSVDVVSPTDAVEALGIPWEWHPLLDIAIAPTTGLAPTLLLDRGCLATT